MPEPLTNATVNQHAEIVQPGSIDAILAAQTAEILRLRALVTEMTRCRDNALAALYRDDVETDPHLPSVAADAITGMNFDWDDERVVQDIADTVARALQPEFGKLTQERDKLRAELEQARAKIRAVEQARCWTNEDGKRFVFAEDLLAAVQLAAPADPPRPSPGHMAVYLDQHNSGAWVDYPTVPPGDDVVPLVTANEETSSRAGLADDGVVLRVVGWIK
jgi:hypothetical protein